MSDKFVMLPVHNLIPYKKNAKKHSPEQVEAIARSISQYGFNAPILVWGSSNEVVAGHARLMAARKLGMAEVPCVRVDHLSDTERRGYILADNKLSEGQGYDAEFLISELTELAELDFDITTTGFDLGFLADGILDAAGENFEEIDTESIDGVNRDEHRDEDVTVDPPVYIKLSDKFIAPPFSVLDAKQGYWLDRKRAWLAIGIESEVGRGGNLLKMSADLNAAHAGDTSKYTKNSMLGKTFSQDPLNKISGQDTNGTSIFDPVLCEIAYRWFSPEHGSVLDPFAGGSVRGVVASRCKRQYTGIDLRAEQVDANKEQGSRICEPAFMPTWIAGDSLTTLPTIDASFDMIMSCPPYADLEVYSDDPADISNMPYDKFLQVYTEIIRLAVAKLKPDRFAVWVIGEVREKGAGYYRNFVPSTIDAFEKAGARFYNEAVLVTAIGTLPLRAGKYFAASRKLGKGHQNVLIFCKGDPKLATAACGEVEIDPMFFETDDVGGAL